LRKNLSFWWGKAGGEGRERLNKKFLGPMGLPSNSQKAPQDVWNNTSNLSHMVKLGNPLVCLYVTFSVYGADITIE